MDNAHYRCVSVKNLLMSFFCFFRIFGKTKSGVGNGVSFPKGRFGGLKVVHVFMPERSFECLLTNIGAGCEAAPVSQTF